MSNSKDSKKNFSEYVRSEQEKDPTVRIIKQEDMVQLNDTSCKHDYVHAEEHDDDFSFLVCDNNKCGVSWMHTKEEVDKLLKKKGLDYGRKFPNPYRSS